MTKRKGKIVKPKHSRGMGKRSVKDGTKQQRMIEMLKRPEGATIEQLAKALRWQSHTVRGTISGALKERLSLTVLSQKEAGGRVYRIV